MSDCSIRPESGRVSPSVLGLRRLRKLQAFVGGRRRRRDTNPSVAARRGLFGRLEAQLLIDYPRLKAVNLADAWEYAAAHPDEITSEIHQNEVA